MAWIDSLRTVARPSAFALLALSVPLSGCSTADDGDDDFETPAADPDQEPQEEEEWDASLPEGGSYDLRGCTEGLSNREIADNLAIVSDFESSAHEMIVCGGLTMNIAFALIGGIIELAQDPGGSMLPEQYTWDGQGNYVAAPAAFQDLRMEVRFYLTEDLPSIGQPGDLVTANLFEMDSYLRGASAEVVVVIDGWDSDVVVEIEHDGPGPLAELLGFGAEPPNPLRISQSELSRLQDGLRDLELEMELIFSDHPSVSTIEYSVMSPRMLVASMLGGTPMALDMISAGGFRSDLEQDLETSVWELGYVDGAVGRLDGEIVFGVEGGDFDFEGTFSYPESNRPQIDLRCAP